jgi:hypothetical protein
VSEQSQRRHVRVDIVAAFIARAEARALLYAANEFDLHEAVDKLQADAARDGVVAAIGQDEVQRIMSEAFAKVRDDLPGAPEDIEPAIIDDVTWFAAGWREAAREYHESRSGRVSVVPHSDGELARLRRLLADGVSLDHAWHELAKRAPGDVPLATLHTADYLAQQKDPQRFKDWLARHSREDRATIREYLSKRGPSCR